MVSSYPRQALELGSIEWQRCSDVPVPMVGIGKCWQARTKGGGHLMTIITLEEGVLHLSISHRTNDDPPQPDRYPTWDEIADARERFLPDDRTFAMLLPPKADYVNCHQTTFHLWEVRSR